MLAEIVLVVAMFAAFGICLFAGFPVAFALGGVGVLFALLGDVLPNLGVDVFAGSNFIGYASERIFSSLTNYSLIPMSLFVYMGFMLERSGVAERLLDAMSRSLGKVPGSLGVSVVGIGMILAASTGIIGASVVLLATVALPAFKKAGYDIPLGLGTVAASGCLGILIPPSVMLIVMGDQLGLSVGDLFMAAVLPGLVLVLLYMAFIVLVALFQPGKAPAPATSGSLDWQAVRDMGAALIAPLSLMVLVLGSIFLGIASPTEASGLGAMGATVICIVNGTFSRAVFLETCTSTAKTVAFLFAIIFGAACFSVVLRGYGGDALVRDLLIGLDWPRHSVLWLILGTVFVLGFVLDWMEIVLIVAPLVMPVLIALNFDPLWVAILMAVCLQTSFLTPPVGMALFYVKSVAPPDVTTRQIYRGIIPFVALQLSGLLLMALFPQIILWLPSVSY